MDGSWGVVPEKAICLGFKQHPSEGADIWGFPKMVGFPNKPMGFPTKNYHFGVEIGDTTI